MGFKSLSGQARVTIGALRQYGLIEKSGKGNLRVSDTGVRIVMGDEADRRAALQAAAMSPDLYQELSKTHADASDNALQSYLITKRGFIADGARKAAKAFRETMLFAKPDGTGYDTLGSTEQSENMPYHETGQNIGTAKPADGVFALNVPFAKGSIAVQVRVSGQPISKAALARVRQYLQLAEEDLANGDE